MTERAIVNLEYDDEESTIMLSSMSPKIFVNPTLRIFFGRVKAERANSVIRIKTEEKNLSSIYRQLMLKLGELDCDVIESNSVSGELAEVKRKELEFEQFSQKTHDIWTGKAIPEELNVFESVVATQIKRKLSDLQFLSALHLALSQNACNFSVPGAGKTTIVYSAFAYLKALPTEDPKHIDRILIIGPLASFLAWKIEFEKCFGREANCVRILAGISERERVGVLKGIAPQYRNVDFVSTLMKKCLEVKCYDGKV